MSPILPQKSPDSSRFAWSAHLFGQSPETRGLHFHFNRFWKDDAANGHDNIGEYLLFRTTLVVHQVLAAVLKEMVTKCVSRKTCLQSWMSIHQGCYNIHWEKALLLHHLDCVLQVVARFPRCKVRSSIFLLLHRLSIGLMGSEHCRSILKIPKNITFFGCLLFSARNELFTNLFALNTIFVASHKSQKWKKQHKWLHLWKYYVWGVVFSLFSLGGQAQGEGGIYLAKYKVALHLLIV